MTVVEEDYDGISIPM